MSTLAAVTIALDARFEEEQRKHNIPEVDPKTASGVEVLAAIKQRAEWDEYQVKHKKATLFDRHGNATRYYLRKAFGDE